MAYLNMRDRRVEATIVYLGAAGAGRATNVEQLGARANPSVPIEHARADGSGDVLRMDWPAPAALQFRDCALLVKVVAPRGEVSFERTRALLSAADGVVLVADGRPEARDENRAVARLLREALSEMERPALPVVVQANKTDLEDALAPSDIVGDLGEPWPCVPASAARGEGVCETIERALAEVLAALQAQPDADPRGATAATGSAAGPRAEGNPLLSALRQVLRETVELHVGFLEARFTERLRDIRVDDAIERGELRREVQTLTEHIQKLERSIQELSRRTSGHFEELARRERKGWFR